MSKISDGALDVARKELASGAGEVGGNNSGPFVRKYLAGAGLTPPQPWCASFVSYCFLTAAQKLGLSTMPFAYSASAIKLSQELADFKVETPQPGDIIVWHRGTNSWEGHTGIVEYAHDNVIQTIEGNHTAKVDRFKYTNVASDPKFIGFYRVS